MPEGEERAPEEAREETFVTPGIDVANLKREDDIVGKYKTKTTVF